MHYFYLKKLRGMIAHPPIDYLFDFQSAHTATKTGALQRHPGREEILHRICQGVGYFDHQFIAAFFKLIADIVALRRANSDTQVRTV